jgi:FkbM family methyltransferase
MENGNYHPRALPLLRDTPFFASERFMLLDVGCSGGIDAIWRSFGNHLQAHGFDPQRDECRRLVGLEANPEVHYHAAYVGLDDSHPYQLGKRTIPPSSHYYHWDWSRSSASFAHQLNADLPQQSNSLNTALCDRKISLTQFALDSRVDSIDFIKTDTDGYDFEVLLSAEEIIQQCGVLGFQVECNFTGSAHGSENSFHNIDRFMREHGFNLYGLSTNRYSRRHLPAPFRYRLLAQTVSGQVIWGDALYLRDGASQHYREVWGQDLPLGKLIKLAMIYELCGLPDCAVELVLKHEQQFRRIVDLERLLDALTPQVAGRNVGYRQYMTIFKRQMDSFMPHEIPSRRPSLLRRCLRRAKAIFSHP